MDYFDRLEAETHKLYEIANEARSKGLDVETKTEVPPPRKKGNDISCCILF